MFIIEKIKQFISSINILFNKPKSSSCIIYGCESIYKMKIIEIISNVTPLLYIESGNYYINFYRILIVIIDFINISLKEKTKNRIDTYSLALKTALLSQTVKTYNPKVIFTFLDNDINFQNTAINMKGINFFCIQNGGRGFYDIVVIINLKLANFFCFGIYKIKFLSDIDYYANRFFHVWDILKSYFIKCVQNNPTKESHVFLISQIRKSFYNNADFFNSSSRKSIDRLVLSLKKYSSLNKKMKICNASLDKSFICNSENEFIDELNYYLSSESKNNSLEKNIYGNGEDLSKIYVFEVIRTAVKKAVEESSQNFEGYLNKFTIKPTDLCELKL